jgi:hypothetical protein
MPTATRECSQVFEWDPLNSRHRNPPKHCPECIKIGRRADNARYQRERRMRQKCEQEANFLIPSHINKFLGDAGSGRTIDYRAELSKALGWEVR